METRLCDLTQALCRSTRAIQWPRNHPEPNRRRVPRKGRCVVEEQQNLRHADFDFATHCLCITLAAGKPFAAVEKALPPNLEAWNSWKNHARRPPPPAFETCPRVQPPLKERPGPNLEDNPSADHGGSYNPHCFIGLNPGHSEHPLVATDSHVSGLASEGKLNLAEGHPFNLVF